MYKIIKIGSLVFILLFNTFKITSKFTQFAFGYLPWEKDPYTGDEIQISPFANSYENYGIQGLILNNLHYNSMDSSSAELKDRRDIDIAPEQPESLNILKNLQLLGVRVDLNEQFVGYYNQLKVPVVISNSSIRFYHPSKGVISNSSYLSVAPGEYFWISFGSDIMQTWGREGAGNMILSYQPNIYFYHKNTKLKYFKFIHLQWEMARLPKEIYFWCFFDFNPGHDGPAHPVIKFNVSGERSGQHWFDPFEYDTAFNNTYKELFSRLQQVDKNLKQVQKQNYTIKSQDRSPEFHSSNLSDDIIAYHNKWLSRTSDQTRMDFQFKTPTALSGVCICFMGVGFWGEEYFHKTLPDSFSIENYNKDGKLISTRTVIVKNPLIYLKFNDIDRTAKVILRIDQTNGEPVRIHEIRWMMSTTPPDLIWKAVREGDLNFLKENWSEGMSPNALDDKKKNMLKTALENKHLDIAEFLLQKGADINIENIDVSSQNERETMINWAVSSDRLDVVRFLVEHKVVLTNRNNYELSPTDEAAKESRIEIMKYLLGTFQGKARVEQARSAVLTALGSGAIATLEYFKNIEKLDITEYIIKPDYLFGAVRSLNDAYVNYLLENGSDINVTNRYGDTPLHTAVTLRNIEMVKLLVEKGAKLNIKNPKGYYPIIYSSTPEIKAYLYNTMKERNIR